MMPQHRNSHRVAGKHSVPVRETASRYIETSSTRATHSSSDHGEHHDDSSFSPDTPEECFTHMGNTNDTAFAGSWADAPMLELTSQDLELPLLSRHLPQDRCEHRCNHCVGHTRGNRSTTSAYERSGSQDTFMRSRSFEYHERVERVEPYERFDSRQQSTRREAYSRSERSERRPRQDKPQQVVLGHHRKSRKSAESRDESEESRVQGRRVAKSGGVRFS